MDLDTDQRIIQLDVRISGLKAELEDLKATKDLDHGQRLRQVNLEREVHQLKLLLRNILQGQPSPFYYRRLPLEMVAEIFSWVARSEDKIALIDAFPEVSSLMHWDKGTLYFSLVYPHVYPYIYRDLKNSYKLCQVSPQFHDIVLDHHRYLMSGAMYSKRSGRGQICRIKPLSFDWSRQILAQIHDELENADYSAFPWMQNMPFLFSLYFSGLTRQSIFANVDPVQQFLTRHGKKIWSTSIFISSTEEEVPLDILHGFLAATPNLYHLHLTWLRPWQGEPPPVIDNGLVIQPMPMQVDPRRFPDLPNLKFLSVRGRFHPASSSKFAQI